MREVKYIFNDNMDWQALVSACVPLSNHETSPSVSVLGVLVSFLDNPVSITDGSLVKRLQEVVEETEHKDKIMNCAVTLYVNMINELNAMQLQHAQSYFLIQADLHVMIGMYFLS